MVTKKYIISPSILSADFANLGNEITNVINAGADWIHVDVMDNHYVPNLTFGAMVCSAIKPYTKTTPIDVHLMVSPVDEMIHAFAKAGANIITIHPDATIHVDRSIDLIKSYGLKAGIALNPATPTTYLDYILDKLDLVLVMSVNPGFGGQQFIQSSYQKIVKIRKLIDRYNKNIILQVDGGVNADNIAKLASCGANAFVAGNAIFKSGDYINAIKNMQSKLNVV